MLQDGFSFSGYERDLVALNRGDGTFLDISGVSGADSLTDGRAAVFADFDNDGDADIFLRAMHGPAHLLLRNEVGRGHPWLRVALEGRASGRDAWGAVVRIKTALGIQTRLKSGGDGFLAQGDPRLLFGLGTAMEVEWLEVVWPSGQRQRFPGPEANSSWLLVEGEAAPQPVREEITPLGSRGGSAGAGGRGGAAAAWAFLRPRAGDPLPAVTVRTLDGQLDSLDRLTAPGGARLVNFWATWCVPCAIEMPELQRLADGGLPILGVSLDSPEDRAIIPDFLERLGVRYPIRVADQEAMTPLFAGDQVPLPLSILLDEEGRIADVLTGWTPEARRRIEELIPPQGSR